MSLRAGRIDRAIADIDWFLEKKPEGIDLEQVRRMRAELERR